MAAETALALPFAAEDSPAIQQNGKVGKKVKHCINRTLLQLDAKILFFMGDLFLFLCLPPLQQKGPLPRLPLPLPRRRNRTAADMMKVEVPPALLLSCSQKVIGESTGIRKGGEREEKEKLVGRRGKVLTPPSSSPIPPAL